MEAAQVGLLIEVEKVAEMKEVGCGLMDRDPHSGNGLHPREGFPCAQ